MRDSTNVVCLLLAGALAWNVFREPLELNRNLALFLLPVVLVVFLVLRNAWASRQGLIHELRWLLYSGLVAFAVHQLLGDSQLGDSKQADFWTVAAFFVMWYAMRKRSRHIPARVKREVIARDLKGGKRNIKGFHFDHTYPFSKGGSHTADNIRLIPRKTNLRKGAKTPRVKDWL